MRDRKNEKGSRNRSVCSFPASLIGGILSSGVSKVSGRRAVPCRCLPRGMAKTRYPPHMPPHQVIIAQTHLSLARFCKGAAEVPYLLIS